MSTEKLDEFGCFKEQTLSDFSFQITEDSEWRCQLFGMGPRGLIYIPRKGDEPNWFWRKMQYLCFGNVWEKVK